MTAAAVIAALLFGAGCSAPEAPPHGGEGSGGTRTASAPGVSHVTSPSTSSTPTTSPGATTPARATCAERIVDRLSAAERVGQLIMVGLDVGADPASLDNLMTRRHVGGVFFRAGWYDGSAPVRSATRHLADLAGSGSGAGLGPLLAADQEGGAVQQLRGQGFTRFPAAIEQGELTPSQLRATATTMARQLKAAGIDVDLAPVADTVPEDMISDNAPIGRLGREFSSDPDQVARMVPAFIGGLHAGGVASAAKHFPGLGRVTSNTDLSSSGITDRTTSSTDPYLRPFAAAIASGTDLVMVSSAIYTRLDPQTNAVFSRAVITDLLRGRLGYRGVVISDDLGAAKAVAAVPTGERAVRFVAAGGDIVLTARPSTVTGMYGALLSRMSADRSFAAQVEAAAQRVVALKVRLGLARCG